MMNKMLFWVLLFTSQAFAVVNGIPEDRSDNSNIVRLDNSQKEELYCTATMVGSYALTAAHCLFDSGLDTMSASDGSKYNIDEVIIHPDYIDSKVSFDNQDIAFVTFENEPLYEDFTLINITDSREGYIDVNGFGGTKDSLNKANFTYSYNHPTFQFAIFVDTINESHTTGGDSGAGWLNENEELIAVHKGSTNYVGSERRETYGTDLSFVSDFLLDSVDGWHYPTLATVEDKAIITVQSLHVNNVMDTAYTTGDAQIVFDESTCITQTFIEPFDTCTYVIESDGEEGVLYLSNEERIAINSPQQVVEPPQESKKSGASFGLGSILFLSLIALRRRRK